MELQRDVEALREAGINLVTISYDSQEAIKRFSDAFGISFTMLSDEGSIVIERFNLLNPVPQWGMEFGVDDPEMAETFRTYVSVTRPNELFVGISFPGTFILDTSGIVQERHFEDFYIERNTIASVLLRRGEDLDPIEAMQVTTPQFNLTTYTSNTALAFGNRFALMFDIEPLEDMHVYAPGADDYQVVSLNLDPNPYIQEMAMDYQEAVDYYFEPFDETIPVYLQPFSLIQELVFDGDPSTQQALRGQESITLTGSLEYQACSSTFCYPPASIPLFWTMELRDLVFRRPMTEEQ